MFDGREYDGRNRGRYRRVAPSRHVERWLTGLEDVGVESERLFGYCDSSRCSSAPLHVLQFVEVRGGVDDLGRLDWRRLLYHASQVGCPAYLVGVLGAAETHPSPTDLWAHPGCRCVMDGHNPDCGHGVRLIPAKVLEDGLRFRDGMDAAAFDRVLCGHRRAHEHNQRIEPDSLGEVVGYGNSDVVADWSPLGSDFHRALPVGIRGIDVDHIIYCADINCVQPLMMLEVAEQKDWWKAATSKKAFRLAQHVNRLGCVGFVFLGSPDGTDGLFYEIDEKGKYGDVYGIRKYMFDKIVDRLLDDHECVIV